MTQGLSTIFLAVAVNVYSNFLSEIIHTTYLATYEAILSLGILLTFLLPFSIKDLF